jgi:protein-tyrosine phosphatase
VTSDACQPGKQLIFVCTGNYYRSRIAEAVFRDASPTGSDWRAVSRGLIVTGALRGLAPEAREFLESSGIVPPSRDPAPLLVDELAAADHVVLLNRAEHEPLIAREFSAVYRRLLAKNAVTLWNVFDLPPKKSAWGKEPPPSQPASSATEHIRFAVKELLRQLAPACDNHRSSCP